MSFYNKLIVPKFTSNYFFKHRIYKKFTVVVYESIAKILFVHKSLDQTF